MDGTAMDGYALLEHLCGVHSAKRIAAETGIPRTTLRRIRTVGRLPSRAGDEARSADLTARLRAFAVRSGLLDGGGAPVPASASPAPPPPSAPSQDTPMARRLAEADAVRRVADARAAQLKGQAEARRQLREDRVLIPTSEFIGVSVSVADELRKMVDRQRRRVETFAPAAGEAVEEEWLAAAPRIESLLRRIEPEAA